MGERLFLDASRDHQRYSAIKIYWIPLHVDHMPELTERATLLTGRRMTRTYRQNQVAAAGGSVFYPTAVQIPVPGTWKIAAAAGRNKGCFIVIFPRPARSDGSI